MIDVSINVPADDIRKMNEAFSKYVTHFNGNVMKAVEKTMVQIIKALRASTKVSSKLRPIVANPDPRSKTDARIAPYGVYKYSQKNGKKFAPIKGTGEYGAAIRYAGRNKILMRVRGGWEIFNKSELESMNMGSRLIQNHKKRNIKRSGLAKSSWGWMLGKLGSAMASNQSEIQGSTSIEKINTDVMFSILSTNKLGYIRKSLTKSPETFMQRAKSNILFDMLDSSGKAKVRAGLRGVT